MNFFDIVLVLLIIIGIIGLFYAVSYNKLSFYKTRIEKSESIIDDALREKYDKLCEINIEIKKAITKKDYLKEYIDLKEKRISNYEMDRKLVEAYNLVNELINDNPELKTKEVNKMIKEANEINETLTAGKNYYNKNTTSINGVIRSFPANIVASIHKFKIKPYFDGKNMQDAVIDDFKL